MRGAVHPELANSPLCIGLRSNTQAGLRSDRSRLDPTKRADGGSYGRCPEENQSAWSCKDPENIDAINLASLDIFL